MNTDQLEKGKLLSERIKYLNLQKGKYSDAKRIYHVTFSESSTGFEKKQDITNVNENFIDFEVMQTLALKQIDKLLLEAETEFQNL